jgi:hypothetical protein
MLKFPIWGRWNSTGKRKINRFDADGQGGVFDVSSRLDSVSAATQQPQQGGQRLLNGGGGIKKFIGGCCGGCVAAESWLVMAWFPRNASARSNLLQVNGVEFAPSGRSPRLPGGWR